MPACLNQTLTLAVRVKFLCTERTHMFCITFYFSFQLLFLYSGNTLYGVVSFRREGLKSSSSTIFIAFLTIGKLLLDKIRVLAINNYFL